MKTILKIILVVLFIAIGGSLAAEVLTDDDFGYGVDIPEGFTMNQYTEDGKSYLFEHKKMNVFLILKIADYDGGKSTDPKSALSLVLNRLYANYSVDSFLYYKTSAAIANGTTTFKDSNSSDGKYANKDEMTFWAEAVDLKDKNCAIILVTYTPTISAVLNQQFMASTLNSLVIKNLGNDTAGIFTYYAYPSKVEKPLKLRINGRYIETKLLKDDIEAGKFVVDCEWAVLSLYAGDEAWQEAWKRYYRAIYRDSVARLAGVANDIKKVILPDCKRANSAHPEVALNEILLSWVQSFNYSRDNRSARNSDFTPLPSILSGGGSDCDSRAILMCVLLHHAGLKTCFFVSNEYKHAIYGVAEGAGSGFFGVKGAKISVDDVWYLLGETTAKNIAPGFISKEMSDTDKWIPVSFYQNLASDNKK